MKKRNIKKRIVTAALSAVIVLSAIPSTTVLQAAGLESAAIVETELEQRSAVADLTISNARELNEFAQKVNNGNNYRDKVIKLTNDIVFDGVTVNNFTPIDGFAGTFDGCGYTISGIIVVSTGNVGLFNSVSGEVKNVTVSNSSFSHVSGYSDVAVAGIAAEACYGASILNCHVCDSQIMNDCYSGYAGGIVGYCDDKNVTIKNCTSDSSIVTTGSYVSEAGGIAGYFASDNAVIENCCNMGTVTGPRCAGGVCGTFYGSMQNCFNTGKVTGKTGETGGIVGSASFIVANCYTLDTAAATNFGSTAGTELNNKAYTDTYMKSAQFLSQLNANRGSNADWFPWEFRGDSVYPLPVKLANIAQCSVALASGSCVYNGKEQTPAFSVTNGSYSLVQDVDYTVSYTNNIDAGTATAVISGTGMYTGDVTVPFTIEKATPSISCKKSVVKTYGARAFALGAKLTSGEGKLSYQTSNAKVASVDTTGMITIKGTGIAVITITCPAAKNYNACTVTATMKVKPRQQSASVKTGIKKLAITWKKDSKATGYQVQYAGDKKFKKNCKTITINKKGKTSRTISKLKKKSTYYVRVRSYKTSTVNGKKMTVTGAWSKVIKGETR